MWEIIEEMGSDPEKKEIGEILYPSGIRPKPEKSEPEEPKPEEPKQEKPEPENPE